MLVSPLLFALAQQAAWPPAPPLRIGTEDQSTATLLPDSVVATRQKDGSWKCLFRFNPGVKAESVCVVGSFNAWKVGSHQMRRTVGGAWEIDMQLSEGVHYYKFVVDENQWHHDQRNHQHIDDGHGGRNSVLGLGVLASISESHEHSGDGKINAAGLEHDPSKNFYLQKLNDGSCLLRYRSLANDVEKVTIAFRKPASHLAMSPVLSDKRSTVWEARIGGKVNGDYTFILKDGDLTAAHPANFQLNQKAMQSNPVPEWAKHAIWYQIMPDRFRNGERSWDPKDVNTWTARYDHLEDFEAVSGQSYWKYAVFQRNYGGDLQGMIEKLSYLKELGVNALYLNPVFQAESHHKYNATSYLHIDDRLGGGGYAAAEASEDLLDPTTWTWTESDKKFLEFVRVAKSQGFKVVIDGVFNHVGVQHPAFQDLLRNGKSSPFKDWFEVTSWDPFKYSGWAGFGELPVFRKDEIHGLSSAEVREHIYAITRRWMDPNGDGSCDDGIDGWRLDVPNEVPMPFWDQWCSLVREINPEAYIVGEIWQRAEEWVKPGRFDAVMNYPFAEAVIPWIANRENKLSTSEMVNQLTELRLAYGVETGQVMQNLVDSHDTDRLVSQIQNPDRAYDQRNRLQDTNSNYDDSRPSAESYQKARLVALFQMTWIGAPMIWAGDEIGMWGADDPMCRRPMMWKDLEPFADPNEYWSDEQHLKWYQEVIALRNKYSALRIGQVELVRVDDEKNIFAFKRSAKGESLLVVLNASSQVFTNPIDKLNLGSGWKQVFGKTAAAAEWSGSVWLKK